MIITTMQEVNALDCGCCPYPGCGDARKECQSIVGSGLHTGFIDSAFDPTYKTLRQTYAGGAGRWTQYDRNTTIIANLGGVTLSDPITTTETTGGPFDYSNPLVSTYSNPVTWAEAIAEIEALFEAAIAGAWDDDDFTKLSSCNASGYTDEPGVGVSPDLQRIYSRYRFAPPAEWFTAWDAWRDGGEVGPEPGTRTTWEMEWDEVFFPKEWDEWNDGGRVGPEPTPAPSLVAERSWVWDGNPANPWSDWYVMLPAAEEGEKRVVNVMIVCWKSSRTGVKPTSIGEVYQFPEP